MYKNNVGNKAVVLGIALVFVFSAFTPAVGLQAEKIITNSQSNEKSEKFSIMTERVDNEKDLMHAEETEKVKIKEGRSIAKKNLIDAEGSVIFNTLPSHFRLNNRIDDKSIIPIPIIEKEDYVTVTNDGVVINKHKITRFELEELKNKVGIYNPDRNYNEIIDGHGTGLRQPTNKEWAMIAQEAYIVDDISRTSSPDGQPPSVDNSLDIWFPPIGTQDGEGSCVTWAVGYYTKTYQEAKERNWDLSGVSWTGGYYGNPDSSLDKIFSPDFIYHQINNGTDGGSYYSHAFNLIERIGACTWDEMPYDPTDSTTYPSESAYRQAPIYRADTGYNYMWTPSDTELDALKDYLADDHLAVISIDAGQYGNLIDTLYGDLWTIDTYVSPSTNHANTIVGYDDNFGPYTEESVTRYGAFKVANSWLTGWSGDHDNDGFYWISYETMKRVVEYFMFGDDLIGYEPELISVFQIDHSKRGECDITLGMGATSSPTRTKQFNPQYWGDGYWGGEALPFPNNKIILDITEFNDSVSTPVGENFFLDIYDTDTSTTGTITHFSVEYYSDYVAENLIISKISNDPPVSTMHFADVYAQLVLLSLEHDVGVKSINYPVDNGVYPPGDHIVNATVKNYGNNTETFNVNCSIYTDMGSIEWLHYSDGVNSGGFGRTGGGTWETAIRLTPAELTGLDIFNLTVVKFYHNSGVSHSGQIKIYGGNTPTSPGSLITTEPFTTPAGSGWVETSLSSPVTIDETQEYWVSVELSHADGEYPFGRDSGPAVVGKGSWMSLDGGASWYDLYMDYGYDYNWNIWAKAELGGSSELVYWDEQTVTSLPRDTQEYVEFTPPWSATLGRYLINVSTKLTGDEYSTNDLQGITVRIEDMPDIWVSPKELNVTTAPGTFVNKNLTIGNSGTEALIVDYISPSEFDLLFSYDVQATSGNSGNAGAEFDGTHFYTTRWASSLIHEYNIDGTLSKDFSIPGVTGLRDLAYDGTYFYGGNAGNTIYVMDFDTETLVGTIPSPTAVRAIAYDEDHDAFWVNNWASDMLLIDRGGNQLDIISSPPSMYGAAYDNVSSNGPFLWFHTGTTSGGGCQVEQYDINAKMFTGVTYVTASPGDGIAGGLFFTTTYKDSTATLGGLFQGDGGLPDTLFGYNTMSWLAVSPTSVTVDASDYTNVTVTINATSLDVGTYTSSLIISSNDPDENPVVVPVYLNVIVHDIVTYNLSLYSGWNLITVPVENNFTAMTLSENITDSVMISRFDAANQTYRTYIVGGPPGFDFPIQDGYGYFVLVSDTSYFNVTGNPITSVSVDLEMDWNMIGWYHTYNTTASSLGENITGCQMVSRFDSISQTFKTYIVGGPPGFDFTITPGMGLFALVDTASTWHGEG